MVDWLFYEKQFDEDGNRIICGVDEAGRGPLAGPVCAAAVILPKNTVIEGVNDSKKLTAAKRERLYDIIIQQSLSHSIAFSSVEEIDETNILQATFLAMQRAISSLKIVPDLALIDGNQLPKLEMPAKSIIKGDSLSMSIACASILAKVTRDRLMVELAEKYPEYEFQKHKGYGTKLHIELIKKHGASPIHRRSFLRNVLKV